MSLAVLAAVTPACDPDPREPAALPTWEEFLAAAEREADGRTVYVVDGDIPVSRERLAQAFDELLAAAAGDAPRSAVNTVNGVVDRWSGGKERDLRYCVSDEFAARKARAVAEMRAAARSWELAVGVNFKYIPAEDSTCAAGNPDVTFAVRPWASGGARAFFPSYPVAERTLWMDYDDFDGDPWWDTNAPRLTTTGVYRHELGHVLGLRHEHTRPESSTCYENSNFLTLGAYDRRSVMHYQWCNGVSTTDLTLTIADVQGVRSLYGQSKHVHHASRTGADYNGDGRGDIGLIGTAWWGSLPVAMAGASGFTITNTAIADFAGWAGLAGAMLATGDFNGDGRTDAAITGPAGFGSVPVALSAGNGAFNVVNSGLASFPGLAAADDARVLSGDFDGDGRTDLALLGAQGWTTMPLARSNGNGSFTFSNSAVGSFPSWATEDRVRIVTGDFNGDARTDIAVVGGATWTSVPVALATGGGNFTVTNHLNAQLGGFAATADVIVVPGDYNGDGRTDLALTGPAGWNSLPVAFSVGDGSFTVTNVAISYFADWTELRDARVLPGDYNGDGRTDIALTGPAGWGSIPVALSSGNGSFQVVNNPNAAFAALASAGARPLVGDFNNDARSDIALVGPAAWTTLPVAQATATPGTFSLSNPSSTLPLYASQEGIVPLQ